MCRIHEYDGTNRFNIYHASRCTLYRSSFDANNQAEARPVVVMLPVMGPESAANATTCEFSDKIPPRFDGHMDYTSYREDVTLWTNLTSLPTRKHGPAIIGCLSGEAKTAAKTVSATDICGEEGVSKILERLDKAYAVDQTNRLDTDLAEFLDYTWRKELSVEHFISGFHTRVDKIAELNLSDKLKGHLLLRQADLETTERHVVIGAASGSYNVTDVSSALRNIYRNSPPNAAISHRSPGDDVTYNLNGNSQTPYRGGRLNRRRRGGGATNNHSRPDTTMTTGNATKNAPDSIHSKAQTSPSRPM